MGASGAWNLGLSMSKSGADVTLGERSSNQERAMVFKICSGFMHGFPDSAQGAFPSVISHPIQEERVGQSPNCPGDQTKPQAGWSLSCQLCHWPFACAPATTKLVSCRSLCSDFAQDCLWLLQAPAPSAPASALSSQGCPGLALLQLLTLPTPSATYQPPFPSGLRGPRGSKGHWHPGWKACPPLTLWACGNLGPGSLSFRKDDKLQLSKLPLH